MKKTRVLVVPLGVKKLGLGHHKVFILRGSTEGTFAVSLGVLRRKNPVSIVNMLF